MISNDPPPVLMKTRWDGRMAVPSFVARAEDAFVAAGVFDPERCPFYSVIVTAVK